MYIHTLLPLSETPPSLVPRVAFKARVLLVSFLINARLHLIYPKFSTVPSFSLPTALLFRCLAAATAFFLPNGLSEY